LQTQHSPKKNTKSTKSTKRKNKWNVNVSVLSLLLSLLLLLLPCVTDVLYRVKNSRCFTLRQWVFPLRRSAIPITAGVNRRKCRLNNFIAPIGVLLQVFVAPRWGSWIYESACYLRLKPEVIDIAPLQGEFLLTPAAQFRLRLRRSGLFMFSSVSFVISFYHKDTKEHQTPQKIHKLPPSLPEAVPIAPHTP